MSRFGANGIRQRLGDARIISLALDAGYNNPSHFTHVFKRHVGVTPRD
jgi:AraC-like DNA-binding protein